MKKFFGILVMLAMTASVVVAQTVTTGLQGPVTRFERPVKKVGDSCSYQKIDGWKGEVVDKYSETVSAVSDAGYELTVTSESEGTSHARRTLNLNDVEYVGTKYSPDTETFSYPIYKGKEWEIEYSYVKTSGIQGKRVYSAKVMDEELIDVLGGKSPSFRIEYEGHVNSVFPNGNTGKGYLHMTLWVLRNGCVAKSELRGSNPQRKVIDKISNVLIAVH